MQTALFYHPDQDTIQDFISTIKVPEFVRQAKRPYIIPELITSRDLYAVHDPHYVDGVLDGRIPNGFTNRNADVNRSIVASNSNFVAAAYHALDNRIACSATQGFHHAHYDGNYGYCTFNGLLLAAVKMIGDGRVKRVLILDGDGHHGDGTDDIIGRLSLRNIVHNVTRNAMVKLPEDTDARGWSTFVGDLIEKHNPGIIMYQAGADA